MGLLLVLLVLLLRSRCIAALGRGWRLRWCSALRWGLLALCWQAARAQLEQHGPFIFGSALLVLWAARARLEQRGPFRLLEPVMRRWPLFVNWSAARARRGCEGLSGLACGDDLFS